MNKQEVTWLLTEKYHGEKTEGFFTDCARLQAGEPLAYLIGSVPFLDTTIYLDSKPLIPRPETEFWVEKAIVAIKEPTESAAILTLQRTLLGKGYQGESFVKETISAVSKAYPQVRDDIPYLRVLDLCAGSGAIGVAVAKSIPEAHVTFAELDPLHLPTIEKNLTENTIVDDGVGNRRTAVVQSNLFQQINETFDVILSNPPYIDAVAETVAANVVAHEPHLALFGGKDGMELIIRIIEGARAKLAPHGQLWLEHEPFQAAAITQLGAQHGFSVASYPDQYDVLRYSILS